ncbi:hypothetical protein CC86DRAFT_162590 [Ophiobolus disseminans]|uniref:RRM domain-containing protein n=1 Tax=Ophiobolus disseminans TaxID=1469910 RepID=A0A6A7ABB7_9PLEO|nr:hypothetical protein CC86DRAFT_162590 [Ophiobolus disseminans]
MLGEILATSSTRWARSRNTAQRAQDEERCEHASNTSRIYIGNMPYIAQRYNVETVLIAEGFEFANIDISIDPFTSRNPSYCFVDMLNVEDAERAMRSLQGKLLFGRSLKVKPCVQKRSVRSRPHSDQLEYTRWKDWSPGHSRQGRRQSPVTTASADLLIPVQENRRLYVGGLPKPVDNHTTDLEIRELFKDFEVEAVSKVNSRNRELLRENGWYVFVDLESAEEAERAMAQMNGIVRWDGNIKVNLANGNLTKMLETIAKEKQERQARLATTTTWRPSTSKTHDRQFPV